MWLLYFLEVRSLGVFTYFLLLSDSDNVNFTKIEFDFWLRGGNNQALWLIRKGISSYYGSDDSMKEVYNALKDL